MRLESDDESSHTLTLRASGSDCRGQGSASAKIFVALDASDGGTQIEVETDYTITGKLARFGRMGMIEDVADALMRDFAACVERRLTGREPAGTEAEAPAAAPIGGISLVASVVFGRIERLLGRLLRRKG